jgi:hypothetical protein
MPDRHAELIEKVPELRPALERMRLGNRAGVWYWMYGDTCWTHVDRNLAHALIERNIAEWLAKEHGLHIEWINVAGSWATYEGSEFIGFSGADTYSEALLLAAEAVIGGKDGEE